ncbi:MAG TPA: hypothetical protein VHD36_18000, partial [Pirellulales bacterium]|nr:hypothetical protein [Pirellulales bacterium]
MKTGSAGETSEATRQRARLRLILGAGRLTGQATSVWKRFSSLLKNSTGCDIAGMRWQNIDVSRYFASRAKLCFALGEVEKSHEGF